MIPFFNPNEYNWRKLQALPNKSFICGYCADKVSSDRGFCLARHQDASGEVVGGIHICPNCQGPTFIKLDGTLSPSNAMGNSVSHVPDDLNELYEESRRCTSDNCYTAAVLLCRKMLMNIAVNQGAKEGFEFIEYVNYLSDKGFIPPNGKHWVDHIRKKGNEATHEITVMSQTDAKELLIFTEMLLRFVYEFPSMVSQPST